MYSFALYLNPYKRAFVYLYCCLGQGWWMCASTVVQWISASVLSDAQKWHLHFKTLFLRLFWHPRHQSLNLFFQEWLLHTTAVNDSSNAGNYRIDSEMLCSWKIMCNLTLKKSLFCSQSFSLILVQGRKKQWEHLLHRILQVSSLYMLPCNFSDMSSPFYFACLSLCELDLWVERYTLFLGYWYFLGGG